MTGTLPPGFIVEHRTRGVLMSLEPDGRMVRPRWSPTRGRDEALRFDTLDAARLALSRLDRALRANARILAWGSWTPV